MAEGTKAGDERADGAGALTNTSKNEIVAAVLKQNVA